MLRAFFIGLSLLFMAGCSGDVNADERFVETFIELRLAEFAYGGDSPMARLTRQEVLKRFGYTREEYLQKLDELLADEDRWVLFQKAVNARLDSMLVVPKNPEAESPSVPHGPPPTPKTPPPFKKDAPTPPPGKTPPKTPPRTRKGSPEDD